MVLGIFISITLKKEVVFRFLGGGEVEQKNYCENN